MRQLLPVADPEDLRDEDLERLYTVTAPRHLRLDFVTTLDGAVELNGRSGNLGGEDDLRVFVAMRSLTDVVLIGSGTAVAENYGPARMAPARRERRRGRGQPEAPPVAVVNSRASLDPGARLFVEAAERGEALPRPIVLCSGAADPQQRKALAEVADIEVCGDSEHVDLAVALDRLAERGLGRVLCEGGPHLARSLLEDGLVDELCLSFADVLAGPGHLRLVAGPPFAAPTGMRLAHLLAGDGMLAGRWTVVR